jgi:hypothetical protein
VGGELNAQGMAVAPNGTELYNVTEGNELFVFDLASGSLPTSSDWEDSVW